MGRGPKPTKSKEAKLTAARKSSKNEGARVRDLEKRLAEALRDKAEALEQLQTRDRELVEVRELLTAAHGQVTESHEQQTATAEILRVISSSPTNVQPVLNAVVESATRLCAAFDARIWRLEGDRLVRAAAIGPWLEESPQSLPLERTLPSVAAFLEQRTVHLDETPWLEDPRFNSRARRLGIRSGIATPLMLEGKPIGVLAVGSRQSGRFTDQQVALLQTFADQAVIAIENVRLFKELEARNRDLTESLEQQTATSEILRVIASSPTNVQPVFATIVESAFRLCDSVFSVVFRFDGERLHLVAQHGFQREWFERARSMYPAPPDRTSIVGRTIISGAIVHVEDVLQDSEYSPQVAVGAGVRCVLGVPMFREGVPIGAIAVARAEPRPFSTAQIELLKTFAAQAVIAIENVRLFTELQEKNRAITQAHAQVTEALDQQTATAEILRVISSSPTDVQPVFDTIAQSAMRLCDGNFGNVATYDGELLHLVAYANITAEGVELTKQMFPMRPSRATVLGRVVVDKAVVHIPDAQRDVEYLQALGVALRGRSAIGVPILREGEVVGSIAVGRSVPRPFTENEIALLQTFADQAVIAIENVRLFKELESRNRDLTDALDRQTATAEILRVISQSQTEVQPVFDTIADNALRLFRAWSAGVFRSDGRLLHLGAIRGGPPVTEQVVHKFPLPIHETPIAARCLADRTVVNVSDIESDPIAEQTSRELGRSRGYRASLTAPMLRDGQPIGVIMVTRAEAGPFSPAEIGLLQTFADQAVIAIENVRLFTELQEKNRALTESLEQQTATAEILRVISSSPTDVQPVFQSIAESAVRLSGGLFGSVYRFDGELIHMVAHHNYPPAALEFSERVFPMRPSRQVFTGRAILDRAVVNVGDVSQDQELALVRDIAGRVGFQSVLSVPLMRDGSPVGAITVWRSMVGLFSDEHIALLQTFADQAVIAIENVRLFKELQTSNRDLTTALDKQTATSEILRVISQSQSDTQPVFDAIVTSAVKLCDGLFGTLWQFDGELIHQVAQHNYTTEALEGARRLYPCRPSRAHGSARAILERAVVHIPDNELDPEFRVQALSRAVGWRSGVFVPMLREGAAIGAIAVTRREPGSFTDDEIALLKTFADQAVIAIENVRLFKELEARTQELTRSVGELTALGEVGRAVSSTLDLETVLSTIVSRAIQLSATDGGSVYEYDEATEEFTLRASRDLPEAYVEQVRDTRPRKGEGAVGRVAQTREPVQIADISDAAAYESRVRNTLLQIGLRALLAVPLIAEDRLVGALIVMRKRTGTFAAEEVALLQTFATQSALAIQNARLFREIEDKSRQLEVASQHKSEFLANMSHELRTPLNAIIGFSEVLSEKMFGELNEKQEEYSKDIHASGEHLLSLINDILDLSKIEAGRMELELSDFDLPTAIENALMLVRERAGRRSIALQTDIDSRLGQIQADERKVRQVVLNLLSNAIKFTPEGGRIDVHASPNDGSVEISVSDTGIGIAAEDQEKVFEEFRQVGTAAKKVEGTGLGLTLCRKFVELHGGRIWVKSELGVGSTFTFTIPVRPSE